MANKTIYGCVDASTGQVKFVGEACDSSDYTGCIVATGVYAGQVKVVIDDLNCDDTYYGCVNWSTGKFQLVIPDDCCYEIGEDCLECWNAGTTPKYYSVTFAGVTGCEWGEIDGTYTLPQGGLGCNWNQYPGTGQVYVDLDIEEEGIYLRGGIQGSGDCFGDDDHPPDVAACTKVASGIENPTGNGTVNWSPHTL